MATTEAPARIASVDSKSGAAGGGGKGGKGKGGDDAAEPKKSKKKLIIIVVAVLLVGGIGAKMTVLAPKKAVLTAAQAAAAAKAKPGPVIPMDEQTLNLAGGHFLRLKLSIVTTLGTSATLDLTEGIQAVINEYSNRSVTELTGQAARDKAAKDLVAKLNAIYPKKIQDVYYAEFVMQ